MVEGWKNYLLPAVAAVLLLGFFAYRCSMTAEETAAPPAPAAEAPPESRREQIQAAVGEAGAAAPPLPDAYRERVAQALQPVVARCRQPRPDDAGIALSIHAEVAAADGIGGIVRSIEIRGVGKQTSKGLTVCIEEGARALELPDAAATGTTAYDLDMPP
jgi:hypothetical protein